MLLDSPVSLAVSLHLSISFVTYCNGVLSQQPVSGYNIAIVIIITVFLFYYYCYFFFLFQTDIASFRLFVLSGDQLTCMQFRTDFYIVHPVSNHHLTPLDIGHAFLFIYFCFLDLKLCEMARPGGSRPMPNLACFNIAMFSNISALSVGPAVKFLPC